jgi:hypothetical protein
MAAQIVAHRRAHRFRHNREIGENCDGRIRGETGIFFDESIRRRDIGRVMTVMVDRHGQCINVGFKRIVPIAEWWNFEDGVSRRAGGREEAELRSGHRRGGESQSQF